MSVLSYQMMIENRLAKWIEKELDMGDWLGAGYHMLLMSRIVSDQGFKEAFKKLSIYYKNIGLCYC